jgi:crotonobetainyl-CoA:carnitine CoA-transferase CaiB-like acyl-CoA transferase
LEFTASSDVSGTPYAITPDRPVRRPRLLLQCRPFVMSDPRLPLSGIRVLELAQIVAGPFCGTLMAEFGAEVIKTELPGKGDDLRRLGPVEDGCNYWYAADNRGKKVITLDLHTPKGQEVVRRLVPLSDVVIENFRPGVLESWGLGWEDLRKLRPSLIMARVTAFGQTGPLRQGPGFAAIASAFGGTWYVNGPADRPPSRPTPVYPDYLTGLFTAFGVMAALRHRDATGEGQWIDAALYESAFRILEYTTTLYGRKAVVRERGGIQHAGWPGGAFRTADGHWIVITTPAQHLFDRLCVMLGQPDLPRDPRFVGHEERSAHMGALLDLVGAWFAARSFEDAVLALSSHDIPHSPIMSIADIFADPHYRARRTIIDVDSEIGPLSQPAVVPRLSATPGRVTHAGPPLGRHTDEVLGGLLAMSPAEIAALRAEGVV